MSTAIILLLFVAVGAAVLSVAQAWAMTVAPSRGSRYLIAWNVSTVALAAPVLLVLGFPAGIDPAIYDVAGTAIVLSALTTAAAFAIARFRSPSPVAQTAVLFERARRLFPVHVGVLIVLGAVDLLILGVVFIGHIH